MPELHVPETGRRRAGGRVGGSETMVAAPDAEQREIDALAQRAMDEAAANGGGVLGKLIGGFLVCYIFCGLSCFAGAVALVVLGVNRLAGDGADEVNGSESTAAVTPDNGLLLLVLGVVPITAFAVCITYLRAQDAGWFRPDNVSPNGLAAKRKAAMIRQGRAPDMDDEDEQEASLADAQQIAGPVGGSNSPPAVSPATMRISAETDKTTPVTPDADTKSQQLPRYLPVDPGSGPLTGVPA
jgi:hypothetical protein